LSTSFSPHPDLSALIGKNASGKSGVLNGILLLKSLFNRSSNRIGSKIKRDHARSRINAKFGYGENEILLRGDIYYSATESSRDSVSATNLAWNLKDLTGSDEWISPPPFLFHKDLLGYPNITEDPERYLSLIDHAASRYFKITKEYQTKIRPFHSLLQPLDEFFSGINYYSASQFTDPARCPVSIEIEDERLRGNFRGTDHRRFLHDLYKTKKTQSREYEEFLSIVGKKGLKLVDDITFGDLDLPQNRYVVRVGGKVIKEQSQRRLLIPFFNLDKRRLSPNQLSEGTFKTLALMFYLVVDKGSLLLIEEPEVSIHHGLLKSILELIKSYSKTKQIIISTHSDFVLDMLAPENIFMVYKEPKIGTKVKSISKSLSARDFGALKTYLAESGNLGEYWRHGGLMHD
jgi:ABC-type Mn2+/Zn2+ transport system ATPase subunit